LAIHTNEHDRLGLAVFLNKFRELRVESFKGSMNGTRDIPTDEIGVADVDDDKLRRSWLRGDVLDDKIGIDLGEVFGDGKGGEAVGLGGAG